MQRLLLVLALVGTAAARKCFTPEGTAFIDVGRSVAPNATDGDNWNAEFVMVQWAEKGHMTAANGTVFTSKTGPHGLHFLYVKPGDGHQYVVVKGKCYTSPAEEDLEDGCLPKDAKPWPVTLHLGHQKVEGFEYKRGMSWGGAMWSGHIPVATMGYRWDDFEHQGIRYNSTFVFNYNKMPVNKAIFKKPAACNKELDQETAHAVLAQIPLMWQ
eukprot:NODE_1302_length_916_cov_145.889734_g1256_i0.p1 GENE.NODE_1302_length_916_cov_145.889734_g1256_i0~~NODE_1302_length_916_cov_145.889734_g1256_i0.p1  ORF type:complete len:213 (+),score=64.43 NODE_1302_length_916_cov_145.889734_g1256_i0:76-714(+)